jgi:Uma2 family endonuclease
MATIPRAYVSPEEYLERERKAETKSEYYRGEMFAMADASLRHATIITNLVVNLGLKLRQNSLWRLRDGPSTACQSCGLVYIP